MSTTSVPLLPLLSTICGVVCGSQAATLIPQSGNQYFLDAEAAVHAVLERVPEDNCFPLFISPWKASKFMVKMTRDAGTVWGVGAFVVDGDSLDSNFTHTQFNKIIRQARKVSWCMTVVVVSDDPSFLVAFAEWSLKGRLLVWSTRLLVVTHLPMEDLGALFASHWTFSMMNTMVINVEYSGTTARCDVLVHLPYSPIGASMVRVAFWTPTQGLRVTALSFFPEKYHKYTDKMTLRAQFAHSIPVVPSSFHGAVVIATTLHFEPYWLTSKEGNTTKYSGMDYNMLMALCKFLNFTYRIIPSSDWDAVTNQVEDRRAYITCVAYVVLPNRYERYDFTRIMTTTEYCFAMAKPVVKPSWVTFYYPLSGQVWAAVLVSLVVVCVFLIKITGTEMWQSQHGRLNTGAVVLETVGSLLGQGMYGRVSTSHSNHGLVGAWLLFGVVMSTVYRSSLIASLTLPRPPHRPETIEEFVTAVDRATVAPYGSSHKAFYSKSESPVFRALGELMHVGVDVIDGLRDALTMKSAHIETREHLRLKIARHHMERDGTTPLYVGKGNIILYTLAWPIPHDAPYKDALDRVIYSVVEAGLYELWRKEESERTIRESRMKKLAEWKARQKQDGTEEDIPSTKIKSLTITHVQGPLALLLMGLTLGGLTLGFEIVFGRSSSSAFNSA